MIMIVGIALMGAALLSISLGDWIERKRCRKKIKGIYSHSYLYKSNRGSHYEVVFDYSFNNKNYHNSGLDSFTKKQAEAFEKGKEYCLYINPKKPRIFRYRTRIIEVVMIPFFLLGLLGTMGAIQELIQWIQTYLL